MNSQHRQGNFRHAPDKLENEMNIGEAAAASGMSAKMIRYYESINLIKQSHRTQSGYRTYDDSELHTLRFVKRARLLGFSVQQIRELLSLWQDTGRASQDVKAIALVHVAELDKRIVEMTEMRNALRHLANACAGDHRPACPILVDLAATAPSHKSPRQAQTCVAPGGCRITFAAPGADRVAKRRRAFRCFP